MNNEKCMNCQNSIYAVYEEIDGAERFFQCAYCRKLVELHPGVSNHHTVSVGDDKQMAIDGKLVVVVQLILGHIVGSLEGIFNNYAA